MKILKIFGVVVGIHVFALVLIFANPGCSSPNKPAPSPSETVSKNDEAPSAASPSRATPDNVTPVTIAGGDSPVSAAPSSFDPNATATPAIRFSPTRPGTPAASTLEASPVGDVTPATTYTVAKGDSLWTIAKKYHLSIAEVAAANNIRSNTPVRVGQKLIIPSKTPKTNTNVAEHVEAKPPAASAAAAPRASGESVKHVVRPGETLGAIARKYQVKVGEIATANNISDPAKIRPGMELTIPGWQAPSGKSAKKGTSRPPATDTTTPPPASPAPSAPESTPSLVIPAPEDGTGAESKPTTTEPPVIRVDDKP
jgi:LysM repeat protein